MLMMQEKMAEATRVPDGGMAFHIWIEVEDRLRSLQALNDCIIRIGGV
jgi:hypothetical protein